MRESPSSRPRRTRRLAALGKKNRVAALRSAHHRSHQRSRRACSASRRGSGLSDAGPELVDRPFDIYSRARVRYVTGKRTRTIVMRAGANTVLHTRIES